MEQQIIDFIGNIRTGDVQTHKNLTVIPLFLNHNRGPLYITLKESLERGILTITEVSEGGSVPELKVINRGDIPVLLLDGEELSGAKQNRVLNTTVLIAGNSETVIPVSCTEQGRWSYSSREFKDSDVMMSYNIKRDKARSVMHNVRESGQFRANQGEVWDNIEAMAADANVHSHTGAMKDVFESKEKQLDDYLNAFTLFPDQRGMMVIINGVLTGFDMISLSSACSMLYKKLLKSYAMEAILDQKKKVIELPFSRVNEFLHDITSCDETIHKSVCLGMDYRFEGKEKVGSALVHEDTVIHMAFFTVTESEKAGRMADMSQRRRSRTR